MSWRWRHDQAYTVPTYVLLDEQGFMGFVRKQVMEGYIPHYFARAYVTHTHDNGFFVKTLAEGKAIVEDMLAQEEQRRRNVEVR